jgi:hypothetical protein
MRANIWRLPPTAAAARASMPVVASRPPSGASARGCWIATPPGVRGTAGSSRSRSGRGGASCAEGRVVERGAGAVRWCAAARCRSAADCSAGAGSAAPRVGTAVDGAPAARDGVAVARAGAGAAGCVGGAWPAADDDVLMTGAAGSTADPRGAETWVSGAGAAAPGVGVPTAGTAGDESAVDAAAVTGAAAAAAAC